MNCPNCGVESDNNALKCPSCGYDFITNFVKDEYKKDYSFHYGTVKSYIAAIIMLIFGAISFVIYFLIETGFNFNVDKQNVTNLLFTVLTVIIYFVFFWFLFKKKNNLLNIIIKRYAMLGILALLIFFIIIFVNVDGGGLLPGTYTKGKSWAIAFFISFLLPGFIGIGLSGIYLLPILCFIIFKILIKILYKLKILND